MADAGIYIHVPFCVRKCPYCDFHSITDRSRLPRYVDAVIAEIGLRQWPGRTDTVYFGGGTPSLLAPGDAGRILGALHRQYEIAPDSEITLEANPGTVTAETLAGYRAAGVNRISLGVQSFSDATLQFLGRIHTAGAAVQAIRLARAAGFADLGIDLIYGIPGQIPDHWQRDLETALAFRPEHISAYLLTFEEGTEMTAGLSAGKFAEPDETLQGDLFRMTREILTEAGYDAYEVSNFARTPEFRSRHNAKYWDFTPFLGLGPAACSFDGTERQRNRPDTAAYIAALAAGDRPPADRETPDEKQRMMEAVMLRLRTREGILRKAFRGMFGFDFADRFSAEIDSFRADGLMAVSDESVRLTAGGMAVSDAIVRRIVLSDAFD